MPATDEFPQYYVFVLRAWEERGAATGPGRWRFSVETPGTGHRRGFANLEGLVAYLTNLFSTPSPTKEKSQMSLKELEAKIQRAAEDAWYRGDMDGLDELYAADYVAHKPPFPDTIGLEPVKQSVAAIRLAYSDMQADYTDWVAEGDTIVYRYTMSMKHTGTSPTMPIPPTGKVVTLQGVVIVHMKDGKVVEEWEFSDYMGFFQQLGVIPALG